LTDARPYRPALTEEDARIQIIERAAIEFDPAVISVLLSLEDLEELRSFARPDEPVVTVPQTNDTAPELFSSFMK
ncbi:MAG TPA: hypothetical protein VGW76_04235, partial [Pyrinomonadaceae bacterium]|nr:hypothetical protein [Pyrinomonadaceae bacterium]